MRKKGLQAAGHTDYVTQIIMVDTDVTRFEIQNQIDTLPQKDDECFGYSIFTAQKCCKRMDIRAGYNR